MEILKKNISNNVINIFWRERRSEWENSLYIYIYIYKYISILLIFISYILRKKNVLKTADKVLFDTSQMFIYFFCLIFFSYQILKKYI